MPIELRSNAGEKHEIMTKISQINDALHSLLSVYRYLAGYAPPHDRAVGHTRLDITQAAVVVAAEGLSLELLDFWQSIRKIHEKSGQVMAELHAAQAPPPSVAPVVVAPPAPACPSPGFQTVPI